MRRSLSSLVALLLLTGCARLDAIRSVIEHA